MSSQELYQQLVLSRAREPRFSGRPARYDSHAASANRMCGDRAEIFIANGHITHESEGCAILAASADLMAEAATGKSGEEIARLRADFINLVTTGMENPELGNLNALASVAEFPSRIRCATLPWDALNEATGNG